MFESLSVFKGAARAFEDSAAALEAVFDSLLAKGPADGQD